MKVNGIIAEYNPFHNGHIHLIENSKKSTGSDYTIAVMSGNFVQRGAPAIIDKYTRARMALENGIDLVIELPACFSVGSAEFFSNGAVALLDKLGVVDYLSFGSECGNLDMLKKLASILNEEPEEYREHLKRFLRDGYTFPMARNAALIQYDPSLYDAAKILESPNNILAIEYLKAIEKRNSKLQPTTLLRNGSNYHDRYMNPGESNASAQAIREALLSRNCENIITVVPKSADDLLRDEYHANRIMDIDDFSSMLYYKLLSEKNIGYTAYLDVNEELSDRIVNKLGEFTSFKQFIDLVKTKDRTYTRVARCLMHILLDITSSAMETYKLMDYTPYAKVLGFRKDAESLLTEIKIKSSIPLITNLADAKNNLYAEPARLFDREIKINEIYQAQMAVKTGMPAKSEFSTPLVIV